jgi:hypothetical protein
MKKKRKKKGEVYPKIWHDISCNCYDCRKGISLKAKD